MMRHNLICFIAVITALLVITCAMLIFPSIFHGNRWSAKQPPVLHRRPPIREKVDCRVDVPYVYPDKVDLCIIVLTFDRRETLSKLLHSLHELHTDGDRASLEIWIDRSK